MKAHYTRVDCTHPGKPGVGPQGKEKELITEYSNNWNETPTRGKISFPGRLPREIPGPGT